MNIVLISCYDRGCLGNRMLSAFLKNAGHDVSLIYFKEHENRLKTKEDLNNAIVMHEGVNPFGGDTLFSYGKPITKQEIRLLIDLLKDLNPSLIGFSLRSISINLIKDFMKDIKEQCRVPILWGGVGPSLIPEECLQYADMVCIGEGEETILELVEKMSRGEDLSAIQNLWLRSGNGIVKNNSRPLIQDLDKLPFPDYSSFNKFMISNNRLIENDQRTGNMDEGFYDIMTSRGCPYSCSYCCNDFYRKLYKGEKWLRQRSVENVLAELEQAVNRRPLHTIYFKDDIFTLQTKWIEEFSEKYPKRIGLKFWCYTHPLYVKKENLALLKKAGMFFVTMGIESGSEPVLFNIFNRRTHRKTIIEAAQILKSLDLKKASRFDIIVNNPLETEENCRETLDLLCELPKPLDIGLSKLSFFPGYAINEFSTKDAGEKKVDPSQYNFWNYLYLVAQYRLPKKLILKLSYSQFLKKRPWILKQLLLPKKIEHWYNEARCKISVLLPGKVKRVIKRILLAKGQLRPDKQFA